MNINIEFLKSNKSVGVFFHKSDAFDYDNFRNLKLTIDSLCSGYFDFSPRENYEKDLLEFIKSTNGKAKTIFIKIDVSGVHFGFLKSN